MIKVLYFASIRARLKCAEEDIELPAHITTAGAFLEHLCNQDENHRAALADPKSVRMAVNQDYAREDTPVKDGDEFALFPPVTGG